MVRSTIHSGMVGLEADGAAGDPRSDSRNGRSNILSTAFVRDSSQDSEGSVGSPKDKMTSPRCTAAMKECSDAKEPTSAKASPHVSPRHSRPPALWEAVDAEADSGAGPESRIPVAPQPSASDDDGKGIEAFFIGTPPGSASRPGRRIGAEVPPPTVALRSVPSPHPSQTAATIAWPVSPRDSLRPRGAPQAVVASVGGPAFFGGGNRGSRGSSPSPGRRGPGVSGAAAVAAVTVAVGTPSVQSSAGISSSLRWASPPPGRSASPSGDTCPSQHFADGGAAGSRRVGRGNSRGPMEARTPLTAPPRVGTTSPSGRPVGVSARRLFGSPGSKGSGGSGPPPPASSAASGASGRLRTPSAGRDVSSTRLLRGTSPPRASAGGGGAGASTSRSSPHRKSPGLSRQHSPGGQIAAVWEQAASAAVSPREGISRSSGSRAGLRAMVATSAPQRKSPPRPPRGTSQDALGIPAGSAPSAHSSCAGAAAPRCSVSSTPSRAPRGRDGKDGGQAPWAKTSTARR